MNQELIPYLDRRLDKLELKVDLLLSKYWTLVGLASAVSTVATVIIGVIVHFLTK